MSKKSASKSGHPLPEAVRTLITRKIRHQLREQEKQLISAGQIAYEKLHDEVLAKIRARKLESLICSAASIAYDEIVASATALTKQWPGIVWETIVSSLEKAQVESRDGQEINTIIDESSWAVGQHPFTLKYIAPEQLVESAYREASRYGVVIDQRTRSLSKPLELAVGLARSELLNTAWQAREEIDIAVQEYLIVQLANTSTAGDTRATPSTARREARKLDTQAMYKSWHKEYRRLKKARKDMSDVWYSQQIAKMDIAQGRSADTIRKQIKK